jgi:GNAT superfamily N-acetyltransferase
VEQPEQARDFAEVAARAYASLGLPPEVTRRLLGWPERWLRPHVLAVVAYRSARPASAALAILSHGIAGLYWVATVEEARRQGLGEACTRRVGNAAFERGAAWLTLQASRQGEPIYRRMGYREVTRYDWYLKAP